MVKEIRFMMLILLLIVAVSSQPPQCIEDGDCDKNMFCDKSIYHCKTCITCSDFGRNNKTNIACSKSVTNDCGDCSEGYKESIEDVLKCDYQGEDGPSYAQDICIGVFIAVFICVIILIAIFKTPAVKSSIENERESDPKVIAKEETMPSAPPDDTYYQIEKELPIGATLLNVPNYVKLPTPTPTPAPTPTPTPISQQPTLGPASPPETRVVSCSGNNNSTNGVAMPLPALPAPATNEDVDADLHYALVPYVPNQ